MKTNKKLLPFRSYSESDVVNQYALEGLGDAGTFVAVSAGNFDDQHGWGSGKPWADHDNAISNNYEVYTKARPIVQADTKHKFLGITLYNVWDRDENGIPYEYDKQKRIDNQVIPSGRAVPILTRGQVMITSEAYTTAAPAIGQVIIPASGAPGKVQFVNAASTTEDKILGKVIGTGSKFGGYVYAMIG